MAIPEAGGADLSQRLVTAALAANGAVTGWFQPDKAFNAQLSIPAAFVGTVVLQRSFDGGTTAVNLTNLGAAVSFTGEMSEELSNCERGVLYRFKVTAFTSGSINARLSQ